MSFLLRLLLAIGAAFPFCDKETPVSQFVIFTSQIFLIVATIWRIAMTEKIDLRAEQIELLRFEAEIEAMARRLADMEPAALTAAEKLGERGVAVSDAYAGLVDKATALAGAASDAHASLASLTDAAGGVYLQATGGGDKPTVLWKVLQIFGG